MMAALVQRDFWPSGKVGDTFVVACLHAVVCRATCSSPLILHALVAISVDWSGLHLLHGIVVQVTSLTRGTRTLAASLTSQVCPVPEPETAAGQCAWHPLCGAVGSARTVLSDTMSAACAMWFLRLWFLTKHVA